jgi:Na+-driven multidrug efflux pump
MFVSLYTTRLILNALGSSDFGIFNVVGGVIGMLGFLNGAMAAASQRYMSYAEGEGDDRKKIVIFNVSYTLHFILGFIVACFLVSAGILFFSYILNIPDERLFAAKIIYLSLVISSFFTILSVPYDAIITAHEDMRFYAFVGILESVLKLSVAYICFYVTIDKLAFFGVLMACIPIVIRIIMSFYCYSHYKECKLSIFKYFDKVLALDMTKFAGWNFVGLFAGLVGNYGQSIVANHFFGVVANAAIGVVTQLQGQMMALTTNMQKALNPVIIKSEGAGDRNNMILWSLRGCKLSYILIAWIAIPICIESDYILFVWLKNVPQWTSLFLILQLIRSLIEQPFVTLTTSLSATGNIRKLNIYNVVLLISPLFIVSFLFYIGFEVYWLFLVMIISSILQNLYRLSLCKKYCSIQYGDFVKKTILPILYITIPVIMIGYVPKLFFDFGLLRFLMTFFACVITMVTSIYLWGMTHDEKEYVSDICAKLRYKFVKR